MLPGEHADRISAPATDGFRSHRHCNRCLLHFRPTAGLETTIGIDPELFRRNTSSAFSSSPLFPPDLARAVAFCEASDSDGAGLEIFRDFLSSRRRLMQGRPKSAERIIAMFRWKHELAMRVRSCQKKSCARVTACRSGHPQSGRLRAAASRSPGLVSQGLHQAHDMATQKGIIDRHEAMNKASPFR